VAALDKNSADISDAAIDSRPQNFPRVAWNNGNVTAVDGKFSKALQRALSIVRDAKALATKVRN
jgi:hypothetical protein